MQKISFQSPDSEKRRGLLTARLSRTANATSCSEEYYTPILVFTPPRRLVNPRHRLDLFGKQAKEKHGSKNNNGRRRDASQARSLILPTDSFHTSLREPLSQSRHDCWQAKKRLRNFAKEIVGTPTLEVEVLLMATSGGRRNVGTTFTVVGRDERQHRLVT